ncbi:MAG: DUF3413 domain-containing protein [Planctomycetes bacterium]|nr:DUF3413 domain-containing protein [Planctomycetota bacterium]
MYPPSPELPRRERLQISAQLWLLEILLFAWLCGRYIDSARPETLGGWIFVHGGRLSCAASLSVLPGLVLLGASALLRGRRVLALLTGVVWSLGLFLLYVDTRLYGIFRYHFNSLVWNVLSTPGADEAVHITAREQVLALLALLALVPLQAALFLRLWRWAAERSRAGRATPLFLRPGFAWKAVLVPCVLLVAGVYAWADITRDPRVMAFERMYPLYPRLTVKRFAQRWLGVEMKARASVDLPESGILLDYPKRAPTLPVDGPTPDILVVVIDSLRADMLTPEVMPRTSALAREGRVFQDHLSGGNATRFGLFGLLYGLHGSYWSAVSSEHRSPVLVDALLARGYDFRVLTSASMDFPEFRSTAWVRVEECVEDRLPSSRPGGRDDGVAERFEQWLGARPADAPPYFAFLLLDAPHQSYWFPADCARFTPYVDEVAYTSIDTDTPPELRAALFNRYKNAVYYADQTTARVLDALRAHGRAENTLIVVTGDHGEEFWENGFWGHTSNFTRAQAHVPFVLAGPGVEAGTEERPTSHLDLAPTLLELLGADPRARAQWCLGESLLAPPAERVRVVAGWDSVGLHVDGAILEVQMASYGGDLAVYDPRWQLVLDDSAILERSARTLATLALECRQFLR